MVKKLAKKFAKFFLGVDDESILMEKGLEVGLLFGALNILDYTLVGVTAVIVGFLRYHELSEVQIFLILWIGNMILSGTTVYAQRKTGIDMTLMEGLRRVVNAAIEKNRTKGLLLESLIITRLIIWNGPDQFILFFHERIVTRGGKAAMFVFASAIQMAVWTGLYSIGYDSFTELFKAIVR